MSVVGNGHQVVYVVSISVIVVTPVVTGTVVHTSFSHFVTVTIVVSGIVTVSVGNGHQVT